MFRTRPPLGFRTALRAVCGATLHAALGAALLLSIAAPVGASELALHRLVPWGDAAYGLTLAPAGVDAPAGGPAAVALASDGRILVVDTLAARVVHVPAEGALETVASAPTAPAPDAALEPVALVALPGGGVAWLDRVRRDVAIWPAPLSAATAPKRVQLPYALLHLAGLSRLGDGRLAVVTAYQEAFPLPAAPDSAPPVAWYAGRLPGVPLPDGRVATVSRRDDGSLVIRWLAAPSLGEEWVLAASATISLDPPARGARVIGGAKDGAVVLEVDDDATAGTDGTAGAPARFRRRLLRVASSATGGAVTAVDLPTDALLYVPFRGVDVGADGTVVVLLPEPEGARLLRWSADGGDGGTR